MLTLTEAVLLPHDCMPILDALSGTKRLAGAFSHSFDFLGRRDRCFQGFLARGGWDTCGLVRLVL
jgi:hypothetical protein